MKIRQVAFGLHLAHKGSDCGVDDHLGADDDSSSSSLNAGTKVMVKWDIRMLDYALIMLFGKAMENK